MVTLLVAAPSPREGSWSPLIVANPRLERPWAVSTGRQP